MKIWLLFIFLVFCWYSNAGAQSRDNFIYPKDSIVEVNGNRIVLAAHIDTILAKDPITGDVQMSWDYTGYRSEKFPGKIVLTPIPVLLNNEKIYSIYSSEEIKHCGETKKANRYMTDYLVRKMKHYYKKLSQAGYNADIRNIVINKQGDIVYYEYSGLQKTDPANKEMVDKKYLDKANRKAIKTLNSLRMTPATIKDQPIAYRLKHYELL